jgi:hypothetical protein
MKKVLTIIVLAIIAFCFGNELNAQKLDKFSADLGKKSVMGKEIRVPYSQLVSYYGFIKPGTKPDETRDGKNFYYLYLWIPVAAPEIGLRMASPVSSMEPEADDFVSQAYTDNKTDKTSYFDTWISLERANGITSFEEIIAKAGSVSWLNLGQNDDSGEMPAQPSGSKYNSLMRVTSEVSDPLKSLVVGLYRIGFTTYKVGEVQGSFIAQLGAPIKLPGVVIAKDLETLVKLITERKNKTE